MECDARVPSAPMRTITGEARNSRASAWMLLGQVALNMTVCRSARMAPASARMAGSKPRSSMRSASSRTKNVTRLNDTAPSSNKSCSRPGVATTIWAQPRRAAYWGPLGAPP